MLGEEVDMVCDNHQVTHMKSLVHAAGGIADKEGLDAQFVHHTDREGHLLHRVALIEVESALHRQNIYSTQFSEDELSAMSFYSRDRKIGNVGIREFCLISYF